MPGYLKKVLADVERRLRELQASEASIMRGRRIMVDMYAQVLRDIRDQKNDCLRRIAEIKKSRKPR